MSRILGNFAKKPPGVEEDNWSRNDGPNGDPYSCRSGKEINIRWFPTTHTLQVRGKQAESVKMKLIKSITDQEEDAGDDLEIQVSRHVGPTIAENANEASDASVPHCCCARMTEELADIRKEIADIRAEQQREIQDTGAQEEINRLRAALAEKQEVIRNLEDERNSYIK